MTTDVRIVITPDISVSNEVVNLGCVHGVEGRVLSAASWLVTGASYDSLLVVLKFIYGLITKKLFEYEVWLFVGNSAWQPDTRIVRYRKLWNALKSRGVEISGGSRSQEVFVEAEGKLKFFGAIRLSELSIETAVKALLDERCSYIAALPKDFELKIALDMGWSGNVAEDLNFISYVGGCNGLLFKQVGEFDDCERGFVSIGPSGPMQGLLS